MQKLNTTQFGLPTCPGPDCFCKTCDNENLIKRNAIEATGKEGPILYSSKKAGTP